MKLKIFIFIQIHWLFTFKKIPIEKPKVEMKPTILMIIKLNLLWISWDRFSKICAALFPSSPSARLDWKKSKQRHFFSHVNNILIQFVTDRGFLFKFVGLHCEKELNKKPSETYVTYCSWYLSELKNLMTFANFLWRLPWFSSINWHQHSPWKGFYI